MSNRSSLISTVDAWIVRSGLPAIDVGGGITAPPVPVSVLVRITSSDGCEGFGDSWVQQVDARILHSAIVHSLTPMLLGEDSDQIARLWHKIWSVARHYGLHPALSAVDVALWDLKARRLGTPVSQLLGGVLRDSVEGYLSLPWHLAEDERVQLVRDARARGFRGIKIVIGHGAEVDVRSIEVVQEAVPEILVAVDANGAYDTIGAIRVGTALDSMGVRWFEEPVASTDLSGLAAVRSRIRTPVSGFEWEASVYALRNYLAAEALSIYQPSIDKCGGITQGHRISNVLDAWGIPFIPHSAGPPLGFAAALHLAASAPTGGVMEFIAFERNPTDTGRFPMGQHLIDPTLLDADTNGMIHVPTGPGLGVDVDMARVNDLAVSP
jgi:D-galactarolactone cycloisomerase